MLVRHPRTYEPERRYVLDVLLREFLGLDVDLVAEDRTETELSLDGARVALADGLFALPREAWLPRTPLERLHGLPVLHRAGGEVDVLGGSFLLLTRYEETVVDERDDHERFPARASLAMREGFAERPLVNEYLELLWTKLVAEWPRLERRLHSFAVLPSHDVDRPLTTERTWRATIRRAAGDVTLRREPGLALRRMRGFAARARGDNDLDVHNTFDWLMDVSERRDLRSAFYFIAGRRAGRLDADYSLDDPWIRRLLRRIHERGHEVGLHGSYTTPTDAEQLRLEREALARVCAEERIEQERWGGRQHFLRWRNPDTWRAWAAAGLDYDSTVGFADAIGFRAGTCFEYPVFDVVAREPLPLRERPLVAMETAALDRLGLTHEQAADRLAALRDTCRRFGGQFTLLWHNSYLQRRRDREVYEAALG